MNKIQSLFIILLFLVATACTSQENGFIMHNVNGYTIAGEDQELITFDAIAVQEGKVVATGNLADLQQQLAGFNTIDGESKTLIPGLIDAHVHVMGLGYQQLDVDVQGVDSLEETLEMIREYAEDNPDLEWIRGRGWNQVLWEENEFPTAEDLDSVVPDRPVYLTRVDGHAAWTNSKAMELAGISRDTPDTQGGRVVRDEFGDATGIFVDATMSYITQHIPERTQKENEQAFELALQVMAEHGLTSVHDARIDVDTWDMYKDFADNDKLITRIYAMIGGTGDIFDELAENGPIESYANDLLALRSVKISADGALGSRGAAMIEHYHDDPGNDGLLFYDQEELNEMVLKGASNGFQMNIHAIGDAANRQVLNSFQYAQEQLGDQSELRHRVEHAQIVHPDDIPRFVELDIIASMQPTHATSDMNMAEDRVGSERMEGAYAWQTFLDQGTVIAGGSDFPVENVNPFYGLYSAVTRQDHGGMPPGGWYSEHRLSRVEALRIFTRDAAYAAHQEDVLGTLETGKWADFILIDRDIFEVDASQIWEAEVLETWVAGEKVYQQ
ncbi:amidohydrolase [Rhodohalobacter barkolensis]|uniref:Amidohydrolase n=1 Tax=Rhodohalobacter barkolensis TaxID=2053187 RepID=A0A2N0VIC0_9BACT|nr:amidohydrolase [Rhodohalobacter barkolensis]PKD43940.1 amidohydrolase [Rhodohalobacter barkolensis]